MPGLFPFGREICEWQNKLPFATLQQVLGPCYICPTHFGVALCEVFMDTAAMIGLLAALITMSSFLPQAIKIHRTKETKDLSLSSFVFLSVGLSLWIVYGILIRAFPVILANSVGGIVILYIIIMKIRHG
jgi:MtN3 and saliva related transmembrane protein